MGFQRRLVGRRRRAWNVGRTLPCVAMLCLVVVATPGAVACDDCGCSAPDVVDDVEDCQPHSHGGTRHGHPHSHAHGAGATTLSPLAQNVVPSANGTSARVRFAVFGDTQGLSILDQLIADVNGHNVDRIIIPGDLVGTGGDGSWNNWIAKAQNFNGGLANILMTPGNHDQPSGNRRPLALEVQPNPGWPTLAA